jgi:hypothetical protein
VSLQRKFCKRGRVHIIIPRHTSPPANTGD